jgi:hypothetical protein
MLPDQNDAESETDDLKKTQITRRKAMDTRITKIKFNNDSTNFAGLYGYQETPANSSTLLHLYDEDGEQLDGGNGNFPSATWEALPHSSYISDPDDFWAAIESLRFAQ